jgi:hypothetical protein
MQIVAKGSSDTSIPCDFKVTIHKGIVVATITSNGDVIYRVLNARYTFM